ncbi:MAG: hypothetical protein JJU24_11060 [Natronohydrobacter sp.]|nr:hypothetical protein [Natronohydrobacter sp.]
MKFPDPFALRCGQALFKNAPGDLDIHFRPILISLFAKPSALGDPLEQIVKLEREMNQVQAMYKDAEKSYGSELLNLVVAKGYLTKLVGNEAVRSWLSRHTPEILEQFDLVINTTSMEEAMEQQAREDGGLEARVAPSASAAPLQAEAGGASGLAAE